MYPERYPLIGGITTLYPTAHSTQQFYMTFDVIRLQDPLLGVNQVWLYSDHCYCFSSDLTAVCEDLWRLLWQSAVPSYDFSHVNYWNFSPWERGQPTVRTSAASDWGRASWSFEYPDLLVLPRRIQIAQLGCSVLSLTGDSGLWPFELGSLLLFTFIC